MIRWLILQNAVQGKQFHVKNFVPAGSTVARSKREALNVAYQTSPKADFDAIPWEQATEQQKAAIKDVA